MKTYHTPALLTMAALLTGALVVPGGEVREEFHETHRLGKTGQISLENVNGDVHIKVWDKDEVKLDAVKRAKKQAHLDDVKIMVDSQPESIRILTQYPQGGKNNSTSVDYTLLVPSGSRLEKVRTVNGGIEIQGVQGNVDASSVNGAVTAAGVMGETSLSTVNGSVKAVVRELRQPVSLKSINGSVTVALPRQANADISADSLHGGVSCDFDLEIKKSSLVGQKLQGKLGDGGTRVNLSTLNGAVHINRVKGAEGEG